MANENKSSAEIAREERKARIEKTSAKQVAKKEKKANQSALQKRLKIIIPIAIVVIALVIGLLYYFGVFQRATTVIKYEDGTKISAAEYEYYYKSIYNNVVNTAYQYETYYGAYYGEGAGLMMTGFDYTKTPENQACSLTEEDTGIALDTEKYGEEPTWADFLKEYTLEQCKEITAIYNAAVKDGFELSDEEKEEIDTQIEELRTTAADSNYSLNAYLMANYGRGMNEKLLRSIITKQYIASAYIESKDTAFTEGVTDEDVDKEYKENPNEYNLIDLRYYTFTAEVAVNTEAQEATDTTEAVEATNYTDEELEAMTKENKEEAKAKADAFLASASVSNFDSLAYQYAEDDYKDYFDTSSDSYSASYTTAEDVNYSTIESSFSEDLAKWAYDSRSIGDKDVFEVAEEDGSTTYIVVVFSGLPEKDDTLQPVAVRHILFALTESKEVTDDDGNTTTETVDKRTMEEARAEAQKVLDEWLAGDKTEDSFSKLATEKSEDTGSTDNGGLYEDITTDSSYVEEFLNWCFADGRKVGDYGIIETEYGCHVMYMSSISDIPLWKQDIKTAISTERANDWYEGIISDEAYNANVYDGKIRKIQNRIEDYAAQLIASLTAETTTAASTAE